MANLKLDYLESDLRNCKLCEWRCGVDRLAEVNGKIGRLTKGVCGNFIPMVASSQLHPAPPASFDAFLTGCNFKCLFCQNWSISMYESSSQKQDRDVEGYYDPWLWAELALATLNSPEAQFINADRLFFTGGEPTCSLPWVEQVVQAARQINPETKVNFDTNGFLTKSSLNRVLDFATSITYDLKAFNSKLFSALTGAKVTPVLRNLKYILKNSPDSLWEVRVMVIPGVHEEDVHGMCKFLADINPDVRLNFLGFRPNFVMEGYMGATKKLINHCLSVATDYDLSNASWSGRIGLGGAFSNEVKKIIDKLDLPSHIAIPTGFAQWAGCKSENRLCGSCPTNDDCAIKNYKATSFQ